MIYYAGIDPSQSNPALCILTSDGKKDLAMLGDGIIDILQKYKNHDVRITIERPARVLIMASAYYCAMDYAKKLTMFQTRFVHPSSWQSKFTSASKNVKRKERKSLSLARAKVRGYDGESDDTADAFNIADYGMIFIADWVDKPNWEDLSDLL